MLQFFLWIISIGNIRIFWHKKNIHKDLIKFKIFMDFNNLSCLIFVLKCANVLIPRYCIYLLKAFIYWMHLFHWRDLFNDIHRVKLCFIQCSTIIYWNRRLAASERFHMFTKPINFSKFHCHILKTTDVWKRWFIK